jgi:hypothetical protein
MESSKQSPFTFSQDVGSGVKVAGTGVVVDGSGVSCVAVAQLVKSVSKRQPTKNNE